jgi:hypothetical protein
VLWPPSVSPKQSAMSPLVSCPPLSANRYVPLCLPSIPVINTRRSPAFPDVPAARGFLEPCRSAGHCVGDGPGRSSCFSYPPQWSSRHPAAPDSRTSSTRWMTIGQRRREHSLQRNAASQALPGLARHYSATRESSITGVALRSAIATQTPSPIGWQFLSIRSTIRRSLASLPNSPN